MLDQQTARQLLKSTQIDDPKFDGNWKDDYQRLYQYALATDNTYAIIEGSTGYVPLCVGICEFEYSADLNEAPHLVKNLQTGEMVFTDGLHESFLQARRWAKEAAAAAAKAQDWEARSAIAAAKNGALAAYDVAETNRTLASSAQFHRDAALAESLATAAEEAAATATKEAAAAGAALAKLDKDSERYYWFKDMSDEANSAAMLATRHANFARESARVARQTEEMREAQQAREAQTKAAIEEIAKELAREEDARAASLTDEEIAQWPDYDPDLFKQLADAQIAAEQSADALGWSETKFYLEFLEMDIEERAAICYLEGKERYKEIEAAATSAHHDLALRATPAAPTDPTVGAPAAAADWTMIDTTPDAAPTLDLLPGAPSLDDCINNARNAATAPTLAAGAYCQQARKIAGEAISQILAHEGASAARMLGEANRAAERALAELGRARLDARAALQPIHYQITDEEEDRLVDEITAAAGEAQREAHRAARFARQTIYSALRTPDPIMINGHEVEATYHDPDAIRLPNTRLYLSADTTIRQLCEWSGIKTYDSALPQSFWNDYMKRHGSAPRGVWSYDRNRIMGEFISVETMLKNVADAILARADARQLYSIEVTPLE